MIGHFFEFYYKFSFYGVFFAWETALLPTPSSLWWKQFRLSALIHDISRNENTVNQRQKENGGINDDYKNCNCITVLSFYWFCCFLGTGTDKKNLAGLRSYPENVQQVVRKHKTFGKIAPKEKSMISVLLGNILLFTVVFSVLGLALKNPLGLNDFGTTFCFFLALGEGLGVFDFVIIDLLWWRCWPQELLQ